MGYVLNVSRDVDCDGGSFGSEVSFILNLPHGFRFEDDLVHVRGFDSMKALRLAARQGVMACDCTACVQGLAQGAKGFEVKGSGDA